MSLWQTKSNCNQVATQKQKQQVQKTAIRQETKPSETRTWFSHLYAIWPGNGLGLFFSPRDLQGATAKITYGKRRLSLMQPELRLEDQLLTL